MAANAEPGAKARPETRNVGAVGTLFRIWSRFYDNPVPQRLFYRRVHRRVVALWGPRAGERVLDVGCGTGIFLNTLANDHPGLVLTGLDLSEAMLDRARRGARTGPTPPTFVAGSVYQMPFSDGAFDVATNCISCHFYLDQVQAFREIHRVLAPGGRFYLAAMSTRRRARPLFAGMAVYYPAAQLEAHLRQAGLEVGARERLFPAVVIFEAKKRARAPS